jgi:LysM repeat protein
MTRLMMAALLVGALGLAGCAKKKAAEPAGAQIPPNQNETVLPPATPGPAVTPAPAGGAVAPAPTPTAVPATPAGKAAAGSTYTIQKGDTIYKIARDKYGSASKAKDILAANPQITDPNKIQVGQVINLP